MYPPVIESIKDKSILLIGFGREGRSSLEYIRKYLPEKEITISDRNEIKTDDRFVKKITGEKYLEKINDFDIVFKSPGVSVKDIDIFDRKKITCQTDLFLKFAPCKKVGITGSKGKTTTSTLIYSMLKEAGIDARLIGNIGVPVFECLEDVREDTVAVIEMSSHQLEFCSSSPSVAVFTNIFEEHLDHYTGGFSGYVNAKTNIARFQTENDTFIYNASSDIPKYVNLDEIKSRKIAVQPEKEEVTVENEHLLGEHNKADILLSSAAAKCFGVTEDRIEKAVKNFGGIEHRMEKVGTFKGITFYNDCIATIPYAVISAVRALKNVGTLIIGGKDRGLDYSEFTAEIMNENIENIICMRDTGYKIGEELKKRGSNSNIFFAEDMDDAVRTAYEKTRKGKICLLSPAASSYNVYKNFEEKGKHYKQLVEKYS